MATSSSSSSSFSVVLKLIYAYTRANFQQLMKHELRKSCPLRGEVEPLGHETPSCKEWQRNLDPPRTTQQTTKWPKLPSHWLTKCIVIFDSKWFHVVPPKKNVPSSPSLVRAFEKNFSWEKNNLNKFDNTLSSHLSTNNNNNNGWIIECNLLVLKKLQESFYWAH